MSSGGIETKSLSRPANAVKEQRASFHVKLQPLLIRDVGTSFISFYSVYEFEFCI